VGLRVEPGFVVGYGIDYAEKLPRPARHSGSPGDGTKGPTSVTLLLVAEVAHETRDPYAQP
jgi:hypothetical protein